MILMTIFRRNRAASPEKELQGRLKRSLWWPCSVACSRLDHSSMGLLLSDVCWRALLLPYNLNCMAVSALSISMLPVLDLACADRELRCWNAAVALDACFRRLGRLYIWRDQAFSTWKDRLTPLSRSSDAGRSWSKKIHPDCCKTPVEVGLVLYVILNIKVLIKVFTVHFVCVCVCVCWKQYNWNTQ